MDCSMIELMCTESGTAFVRNAPLKQYCTMKIGGACDILVKPNSENAVIKLLNICKENKIPYFILGKGSNVLFPDEGFHGVIILIGQDLGEIIADKNTITAGAGAALNAVCKAALDNSLSGAENLYGIPGSVGGALFMNAGAFGGEMKDIVTSCRYIDEENNLCEMSAEDMELCYRHSAFSGRRCVITSVTMEFKHGDRNLIKARMDEVMARRREKQPLEYPSCGSTFKRPQNGFAAALIEECGLKGRTVGGAQVSEKHSGFVINKGGATFEDVTELIRQIKNIVKEQKGVELECEMLMVER